MKILKYCRGEDDMVISEYKSNNGIFVKIKPVNEPIFPIYFILNGKDVDELKEYLNNIKP